MSMEEKLGIIIAVIALFGGGVWNWLQRRKNKAGMQQVLYQQPMLTAQAQDGSVARVVGTVHAKGQYLRAPLTGKTCVAYWTRIITIDGENKDKIEWAPFAIDRGPEGLVEIDTTFATMDLDLQTIPNDGVKLEQFAIAMGLNISMAARSQYYEMIIEPDQRVSIAGTVMHDAGGPQGYRGTGVATRLAGNQQHPLVIGR